MGSWARAGKLRDLFDASGPLASLAYLESADPAPGPPTGLCTKSKPDTTDLWGVKRYGSVTSTVARKGGGSHISRNPGAPRLSVSAIPRWPFLQHPQINCHSDRPASVRMTDSGLVRWHVGCSSAGVPGTILGRADTPTLCCLGGTYVREHRPAFAG
jgi:hypothetical protein